MARTAAELYRLHAAHGHGEREISTLVELLGRVRK
jgi:3-hydroxyisobutyrate dehydrogenase-like beta-hydroxyacid dehydrogenase